MAEQQQKDRGLTEYQSRDGQQIKLSFDIVRRYFVSGKPELVKDEEIMLYMGTCKARGLNPAKKDCYLIKYTADDPAAMIVSIDYYRSRARAQADCEGWHCGVIVKDAAGGLAYRNGAFTFPGDTLLGGWFKARPSSWAEPYEWAVNLAPYLKKDRYGHVTNFWREENQPYMIAKVAESQGLRRLWPDEFQGLFVAEEIIETTATPEPEPRKELGEPVRKVNEKERKRFFATCEENKLDKDAVTAKLAEYGYANTYDIRTDKYVELMAWATTPPAPGPEQAGSAEGGKPDA
jgi:phage recombination protein Bet